MKTGHVPRYLLSERRLVCILCGESPELFRRASELILWCDEECRARVEMLAALERFKNEEKSGE